MIEASEVFKTAYKELASHRLNNLEQGLTNRDYRRANRDSLVSVFQKGREIADKIDESYRQPVSEESALRRYREVSALRLNPDVNNVMTLAAYTLAARLNSSGEEGFKSSAFVVHGGQIDGVNNFVRPITGSVRDKPDIDLAFTYSGVHVSSEAFVSLAEQVEAFLADSKTDSAPNGYGLDVGSVRTSFFRNLSVNDLEQLFDDFNFGKGDVTYLVDYFNPSFPPEVNLKNQENVLTALESLHGKSVELWELVINELLTVYKERALRIKHKYLDSTDDRRLEVPLDSSSRLKLMDTQLFGDIIESTGSQIPYMRMPAVSLYDLGRVSDKDVKACESLLSGLGDPSLFTRTVAANELRRLESLPVSADFLLTAIEQNPYLAFRNDLIRFIDANDVGASDRACSLLVSFLKINPQSSYSGRDGSFVNENGEGEFLFMRRESARKLRELYDVTANKEAYDMLVTLKLDSDFEVMELVQDII